MNENETRRITDDICVKLFGCAPERAELATVGMVNTVYIAEIGRKKFVIRLNSEKGAYAESTRLLEAAGKLGLPVPRVIGSGSEQGYEYLAMSFLRGRDLGIVYHELDRESKREIAAELVRIQQLAELLPVKRSGGKWYNFIFETLDTAGQRIIAGGYFDAEKVSRVKEAARQMEGYFNSLHPAAYLDDISTKNLLIESGHVSGVVDIDEIGFGDKLTYVALMRTALLNMGLDDDICGDILNEMNADAVMRRAELFYCLMYCVDFMGERGMTFNGRMVDVDSETIDRLNGIFDGMWDRWAKER